MVDRVSEIDRFGIAYCPKVIDFGYSIRFQTDQDTTEIMARSEPWCAPELETKKSYKLEEMRKMDTFSFGMLCVWVMFEEYLSCIEPLPEEVMSWAEDCIPKGTGKDSSKVFLRNLKEKGKLARYAELLLAEQDLLEDDRKDLGQLFRISLENSPLHRDANWPKRWRW
jgi:hypothetical protein